MRIAICVSGQLRTWKKCYKSWNKYKNKGFEEKHCHQCSKSHKTSFEKPICYSCFKS